MNWLTLAILASLFWGLCYVFEEHLFKEISVLAALAIINIIAGILFGIVAWYDGSMRLALTTLVTSAWALKLLGLVLLSYIVADFLICQSIAYKNASLVSIIEISYPVFTVLFSYLLFRENNLTWATAVGGALIFAGSYLIHQFSN